LAIGVKEQLRNRLFSAARRVACSLRRRSVGPLDGGSEPRNREKAHGFLAASLLISTTPQN